MEAPEFDLPDLLREIADIVGIDAALAVAGKKGGTRATFSRRPKPEDWLSLILGQERAIQIGEVLCGDLPSVTEVVPMGPNLSQVKRWKLIFKLVREDRLSYEKTARIVGCHYKTVERIVTGKRATIANAISQTDLFD